MWRPVTHYVAIAVLFMWTAHAQCVITMLGPVTPVLYAYRVIDSCAEYVVRQSFYVLLVGRVYLRGFLVMGCSKVFSLFLPSTLAY